MLCLFAVSCKRNLGLPRCRGCPNHGAMTTGVEWQGRVGQSWAQSWRQTDRAFAGITANLLDLIAQLPGETIVDIGCGAGELSLALARQRGRADVTGIDISQDLVETARQRAGEQPRLRFEQADASVWQPERAPDLMVSRHGVMFFDDPVAAFAHLRSVCAPGARLAFSCFRSLALNRWASEPAAAVGAAVAAPEGRAPGPFAFADRDYVTDLLGQAGWGEIQCEERDVAFVVGQGEDAVDQALAFFSRIGPTASRFSELEEEGRAIAQARLRELLETRLNRDLVAYPAAIWLCTARN